MTTIVHPIDSYMENMDDISSLMTIYSHVSNHPVTTSTGEPCHTEILLKSSLVFIVTCWDEYIKQSTSFNHRVHILLIIYLLVSLAYAVYHQSLRPVTIDDIDYFSLLVNKLASISANVVREHIHKQTGEYPWSDSGILDVPSYEHARCA